VKYGRALAPIALAAGLSVIPAPDGLAQHAWFYFAIFAGVILGLILEPLPGAAVGWIGVTVVAVLSRFVFFSPEQLADPGFDRAEQAIRWALSGFSNTTVWLIFSAFTFGLGYEKTGLGRRIALELVRRMGGRTLTLGYAVMLADAVLAPFTPSSTARGAGTIYPIVRNLPPLYDSLPNDPSARLLGSYVMWTAISATSISSTLFLTGMAPNPLAVELLRKSFDVSIGWMDWFTAMAPFGIPMMFLVPLMTFVLYPPRLKRGERLPGWAAGELLAIGPLSIREVVLAVLVVSALVLWIFGGGLIDATTVGIGVVSLMIGLRVVSWNDVLENRAAWNTFVWFASLVTLAAGLSSVGFLKWVAALMSARLTGLSSTTVIVALTLAYFLLHYMFASITAHTTALFPIMLAVGSAAPGMDMRELALVLGGTHGIMGILTPYASGPSPAYYGSGYLPSKDYWRLGALFGAIFLVVYLIVVVPWVISS
jgi:L-tartrate/succinate antiporter